MRKIDAFLADDSPEAYERVVDRLLQSPHYGEHMARYWLDAARYGDTHGLHIDAYREIWPYRDWVVAAFNRNLPFDEFATEQLAGDLLPNPTRDQIVATGFLRAHVTTAEGGSIDEEVYVRNVVDRVVTNSTVFSALTFDCTRCHDHKYDPFTQKGLLFALCFLQQQRRAGHGRQRERYGSRHARARARASPGSARVGRAGGAAKGRDAADARRLPVHRSRAGQYAGSARAARPGVDRRCHAAGRASHGRMEIRDGAAAGVAGRVFGGADRHRQWAELLHRRCRTASHFRGRTCSSRTCSSIRPTLPGRSCCSGNAGQWAHRAYWGENLIDYDEDGTTRRRYQGELPPAGQWVRLEVPIAQVGLEPGMQINGWAFTQYDGTVYWDQAGIETLRGQTQQYHSLAAWEQQMSGLENTGLPADIEALVRMEPGQRTALQERQLRGLVPAVFLRRDERRVRTQAGEKSAS